MPVVTGRACLRRHSGHVLVYSLISRLRLQDLQEAVDMGVLAPAARGPGGLQELRLAPITLVQVGAPWHAW